MRTTDKPKTQWSYSRASTFATCPRQYQYRYVDKLDTLPDQTPNNALYLGTAIHTGLEKDVEAAIESYKSNYYILTTEHYNEIIKLENLIPKVKAILPEGDHEVKIETEDYIGFADLIAGDHLFDFKYSNNRDSYMGSPQLHLYKYFAKRPINKMSYVFIPKIGIRQGKRESISEFRDRLRGELEHAQPEIVDVEYDERKVKQWQNCVAVAKRTKVFPKSETKLCDWCPYKLYCLEGIDYEIYRREKK